METKLGKVKICFREEVELEEAFVDNLFHRPTALTQKDLWIERCFICQKFGHSSSKCKSKEYYGHCSQVHSYKDLTNKWQRQKAQTSRQPTLLILPNAQHSVNRKKEYTKLWDLLCQIQYKQWQYPKTVRNENIKFLDIKACGLSNEAKMALHKYFNQKSPHTVMINETKEILP